MKRRALTLAMLFVGSMACGDSTGPKIPSLEGTWRGTGVDDGTVYTLQVTLHESDTGAVTGTGVLSASTVGVTLTVKSGAHDHPDVTVTLGAEGFQDMLYRGAFSGDDTVIGTVNGSGFVSMTVTLTRQ